MSLWPIVRRGVAAGVLGVASWVLIDVVRSGPDLHTRVFEDWYGNWTTVAVVTGVFVAFLLGFAQPRRGREWRNAGLYTAFLISLFTEMFYAARTPAFLPSHASRDRALMGSRG